jgi:cadmium resistance transport/sequestration family protein
MQIAIALFQAIGAFLATNLDDLVVLMLFFSQTHHSRQEIIVGQYLGFACLVLLSLPGYWGGLLIPSAWIGLLGFLPLIIGIKLLWQPDAGELAVPSLKSAEQNRKQLFAPLTAQVAALTIANGGDNIGIYVPLFASQNIVGLLITLGTFAILVGIWCGLAIAFVQQPAIAKLLTERGAKFVPWVLILLGAYILYESGTVTYFFSLV